MASLSRRRGDLWSLPITGTAVVLIVAAGVSAGQTQLPTTNNDFFQPGTQPDPSGFELDGFQPSTNCSGCHSNYYAPPIDDEPHDAWSASMMAQSTRDPVWQAALAIANQDADKSGESCMRCHAPTAWLAGRSTSGQLEDLLPNEGDFDGVNCHFCHRTLSPVLLPDSPSQDKSILKALTMQGLDFAMPGQGRYVVDPTDVRRGPFPMCTEADPYDCEVNQPNSIPQNLHSGAPIIESPFHRSSEVCASCHDVSTPTFTLQDGIYVMNAYDSAHPTQNPHEMFPEQRTYSEWKNSQFANGGVVFPNGRFGGNLTAQLPNTVPVSSCQDCHMPDVTAGGCGFYDFPPFWERDNMPKHALNGANTWVVGAVLDLYGEFESGLTESKVEEARQRTVDLLQAASDMELSQIGDEISVRVINQTGHKLPTGYPEGRRMWLNVRFLDGGGDLVAERGAYDGEAATLEMGNTKVYEAKHTFDESVAAATGLAEGTKFHLVLNNVIEKDNRIPPMGFTNAAFEAAGAAPAGSSYADGQHWDDTLFAIPSCAEEVEVRLYYQTTSREYIEFLRDTITDPMNDAGQVAYDAWVARGKSEPVEMDLQVIPLAPVSSADINGDGSVNVDDLVAIIIAWGACGEPCPADINCTGAVDVDDLVAVIVGWSA